MKHFPDNDDKYKGISSIELLKETKKIHGSVLCEHVRSIDYEIRNLKYIETASDVDLLIDTEITGMKFFGLIEIVNLR